MNDSPSKELLATPIARGSVVRLELARLGRALADAMQAFIDDPTDENLIRLNEARERLRKANGGAPA